MAITHGQGRREIVEAVESAVSGLCATAEWAEALRRTYPDDTWELLQTVMRAAAEPLLRKAPFRNEQYERFVNERKGLLAERRALREGLVAASGEGAQQEIEWQLAVLSRRCARHRRQAWREREAILIEELREAQRSDRPFEVHRLRRLIAANKRGPLWVCLQTFIPAHRRSLIFMDSLAHRAV